MQTLRINAEAKTWERILQAEQTGTLPPLKEIPLPPETEPTIETSSTISPPPPPIPISPSITPLSTSPTPNYTPSTPQPINTSTRPSFGQFAQRGVQTISSAIGKRLPGPAGQISSTLIRGVSGNPRELLLAGGTGLALLAGGPLGAGIFLLLFSKEARQAFLRNLGETIMFFIAWIFITIAAIGVFTALILFIINSGAYVVPPGESLLELVGLQQGAPSTTTGPGGAWPNCWPTTGWITQGPATTGSHKNNLQAIDISEIGALIYATHDGTAKVIYGDEIYGNHVIITSPEGFQTWYGHFSEIYIGDGPITAGALLGKQGCTGTTYGVDGSDCGIHLHYELRNSLGILINQIVPAYTVGGYTTGCFAKDAGGSGEPPTPNTSCTKAYGICTSNCTSSSQILTPPPGGWTDCSQICCQSTVPPGEETLCTTSGGECSSSNCFPDPVIPLPEGQSAWPDCSSSGPICCQKEPVQTCASQGATCQSTCHPDCIREFAGCTTQLCCDEACSLIKPPPEPATAVCANEGGYCDSTCISGEEVDPPTGISAWSDCSSQKPLCCRGGIPVGYIP